LGRDRAFDDGDKRIQELRSLRGFTGLKLAGVKKCEQLLGELGVDAPTLLDWIKTELSRMGAQREVEALRWAYAVRGEAGSTVGNRRASFAAGLPKGSPYSDGSIEKWENDAIDELLGRLLDRGTRQRPPDRYVVVQNIILDVHYDLAELREDRIIDMTGTVERGWRRSFSNENGDSGLRLGRAFYYQCPTAVGAVDLSPVLLNLLFPPHYPPPAAVWKAEGATLMEAQLAHRAELELHGYQRELNGLAYYHYGALLQSPEPGWVVAFFWNEPGDDEDSRVEIWRQMGFDLKTGIPLPEEPSLPILWDGWTGEYLDERTFKGLGVFVSPDVLERWQRDHPPHEA
jgi:hypothetical protein